MLIWFLPFFLVIRARCNFRRKQLLHRPWFDKQNLAMIRDSIFMSG